MIYQNPWPSITTVTKMIYLRSNSPFRAIVSRLLFLSWLFFRLFFQSFAQQEPASITIDLRNKTLSDVLQRIQQQSGYTLSYSVAETGKTRIAAFAAKGTLRQVLDKLKDEAGIEYNIAGKRVSIRLAVKKPAPRIDSTGKAFTGTVMDAEKKKPLEEVEVFLLDKASRLLEKTITGRDGSFTLVARDSSGTLVFSKGGYLGQTITARKNEWQVIELVLNNKMISEVVVSAKRRVGNQKALLNDRKNAAVLSDGISAENIEKTASITTAQALQRVAGVTVTDDKYIAVRGLGDRSVIGQLNGIRLASSDPDRSALPLDLVPANLLDNIVVFKSITPDKPADASGGLVELKTKSIPASQSLTFLVQQGTNSNIGVGGKFNSFYNSEMGFLGQKIKDHDLKDDFKNLSTQYPGGLASIQRYIAGASNSGEMRQEVDRINRIMHGFDPVLTTRYRQASLDGIYSVSYGNSFQTFKDQQLGVIVSGSYYNRSTDITNATLNQYSIYQGVITGSPYIHQSRNIPAHISPNTPNLGKYVAYRENTGTQTLNYGFLAGLAYKFSANHELSFQYMGSRGGETQATHLDGQYSYVSGFTGPIYNTVYSLKQTHRIFNTYNIQGEHKLGKGKYAPRLSYNAASSKSLHNNPDYRFVNIAAYYPEGGGYYMIPDHGRGTISYLGTPAHYSLVSGYVTGYGTYGIIQADPNGRRFRNLSEINYNYKADITLPFSWKKREQLFKVGVNYLYRERDFSEYRLSLPGSNASATAQYPLYLTYGDPDRLVSYSNIGIKPVTSSTGEGAPLVNGFLYNIEKSPNNYLGFYETNAFYGMLDLFPVKNIRVTGGVRFEKTDIESKVDTADVFIDPAIKEAGVTAVYINPVSKYNVGYKPYYSVNLTYTYSDNMNFRLAYNTTLARPEIREMTNVFEFDPFQQALVVGNPSLINQTTHSYDFRWEWFPNPGEVLAATAFGKRIINQLEKVFTLNTAGTSATFPEFPTIAFRNNPNEGQVWGVELEVVKDLGRLWAPLQNFFIGTNVSLVQSDVVKTKERLDAARIIDRQSPKNSPLFEQAPYSINAYINYTNLKKGSDVTVNFNMVGERLVQISMDGTPDVYSNPAPVLDLVFSQKITRRLLFKGYVKNLLNPAFEETYNNPGTGSTFYETKFIRRSYKRGTEWMAGFTYNLF